MKDAILLHFQQHWAAISAAAGILFFAAVSCMPLNPPTSFVEYWHWVRESLQTAIPAARRHPSPLDSPADPAKPKE